jgi:two-component system, OmpR family, sensor kinase
VPTAPRDRTGRADRRSVRCYTSEAKVLSGGIVVSIADQRIGVPAADLDRLFERYHRGGNVSGIVGTRVGLYLVKVVAELHGGRMEVESAEGKGSRFTVWLPVGLTSRVGGSDLPRASAPNEMPSH